MKIAPFKQHVEPFVASVRIRPDEDQLLALAQAEVEALAEEELPPDPGDWFPHLHQ